MAFSLFDISDRELLYRLDELADNEGLCTTAELAQGFGLEEDEGRQLSPRLSWLKRFGALESEDTYRTRVSEKTGRESRYKVNAWRITVDGETYFFTNFNASKRRSVESIDEANIVEAVAIVAARYQATNSMVAKSMMRRQWVNSTGIGRPRIGAKRK